jgi:hypothetical protein
MQFEISTPALLFPTLALLMAAYTNRFLALATLIRNLYGQYQQNPSPTLAIQLQNLKFRVVLLRNVQIVVAISFFLDVLTTLFLFLGWISTAMVGFFAALLLMLISLGMFVFEAWVSLDALEIHVKDLPTKPS